MTFFFENSNYVCLKGLGKVHDSHYGSLEFLESDEEKEGYREEETDSGTNNIQKEERKNSFCSFN